ncbi:MAG: hypothetical protein A3G76_06350 [Acidobacteria bacterium RIFCSPLOWO2_12_FULL_65_11]|nr:MAG: hypothetical protein A3G76_06350 [Acidobacteria bacterium RIFCSPLOWO2_12_FULL_65_11]
MPFLTRLIVNAAALWVATRVVSGVTYTGDWLPFLGVAAVFGVVNAFIRPVAKILTFPLIIVTLGIFALVVNGLIRPVAKILTFPLIIVTLGIFALVVNGLMLWLTSSLAAGLGLGFHVGGFWSAFWGALVVSIVSTILSLLVAGRSDKVEP